MIRIVIPKRGLLREESVFLCVGSNAASQKQIPPLRFTYRRNDNVVGAIEDGRIRKALMSKQEMRKRLATLSFSEKVQILEKLRDRSLALAAAGLRQQTTKGSSLAHYGKEQQ